MSKAILVTRKLPPLAQQKLLELCKLKDVKLDQNDSSAPIQRQELLRRSQHIQGLLVMLTDHIDKSLLNGCISLRVVSTMSVGLDHVDTEICKSLGISVCNTPDVLTDATAELTIALLLMTVRPVVPAITALRSGNVPPWDPCWMCGSQLSNKKIGIFGMGRLGLAIAERLKAFKCDIWYTSKSEKSLPFSSVTFDQLLESDIIIISCALNEETRGLFDQEAFSRMKTDSFLINVSRGPVINEKDLLMALNAGRFKGVGLDVTMLEPLPKDHPLLAFERVVVLPHIGSATMETREAMAMLAVNNLFEHLE